MSKTLAAQLRQNQPFSSAEQEALLGIRMAAARVTAPWAQFLKTTKDLSTGQYNVLRILRGSPEALTCGEIGERTIARDPDVTRLVDRLAKRGLVRRTRSHTDRRVVKVEITAKGRDLLDELDPHARRMPRALLGHLSQTQLQQLSRLLSAALDGMGSFP
ncbi:MAG TPA: MarR family transcriptional regulator [Gemmatimonadaceae bacterium]|nr:MarR family transcriptional regulator [Gemmatimonadaceae bacterium]